MKYYAGFTIGPIIDLMSSAKKTRELWFGSYFFSWFMEEMVKRINGHPGIVFKTPFVPIEPNGSFKENSSIAGKYHDRFIISSTELEKDALYSLISKTSDDLLNCFNNEIDRLRAHLGLQYLQGKDKELSKKILANYLQRNFVVLEAACIDERTDKKVGIVGEIDKYLNSIEENRTFRHGHAPDTCFRCRRLEGVVIKNMPEEKEGTTKLCPLCLLRYDCYESTALDNKLDINFKFPPVCNIAAASLLSINKVRSRLNKIRDEQGFLEGDDEFKNIEKALKECGIDNKEAKLYHRYFAILYADGDNLGKLAGSDAGKNLKSSLTERLARFADETYNIITEGKNEHFNCWPVYIGGDDILAIVPVVWEKDGETKTVLSLAMDLSKKYDDIVNEGVTNDEFKSSLSIGINIAYYKFPLARALANAGSQLFEKAKGAEGKNSLAIKLTKHSGHQMEMIFKFDSKELEKFNELLTGVFDENSTIKIPNGLHHNLGRKPLKTVLASIDISTVDQALEPFFENNFDEPVHGRYKDGLKKVQELFSLLITDKKNKWDDLRIKDKDSNKIDRIDKIDELLNKIRLIKFLKGEREGL